MKKKPKTIWQVMLLFLAINLCAQNERQLAIGQKQPDSQPREPNWECGSTLLMKKQLDDNPSLIEQINKIISETQNNPGNSKYNQNNTVNAAPPNQPFIIPVVFHVIQDPGNPTPVPDYNRIKMQLASLNAAFSNKLNSLNNVPTGPRGVNSMIQFCFAKLRQVNGTPTAWPTSSVGVIYHNVTNTITTNININSTTSMATLNALTNANFPVNMYLNIYCVPNIATSGNTSINAPPTVIGVGTFPWMSTNPFSGIVMRSDCIGNNTYNNFPTGMFPFLDKGNILVHEAGHYLGLFHTFETINNNQINTAGGAPVCYGLNVAHGNNYGDLCFDTPPTLLNGQVPLGVYNTCTEAYAPYAGAPDEPCQIENFMSYIDDDYMNTFTNNQNERMWAALSGGWSATFLSAQRASLVSASNLVATGVNNTPSCGPGMLNPNFNYSLVLSSITCSSAAIQFLQPVLPNYLSAITHTWYFGDNTTSTATNPLHTYNAPPSTFIATLVVSDGSSTASSTMAINLPVGTPTIVGQSGMNMPVCRGTEQTILIKFPAYAMTAVITDGTTTYVVNTNFIHNSSQPRFYNYPFTFTIQSSGTWSISMGNCNTPTSVATFTVVDCCSNLVNNGDFEQGNVGFTSDYNLTTNSHSGGNARINFATGMFAGVENPTGQFFMVDASGPYGCSTPSLNRVVLAQNITGLQPNVTYYVSVKAIQSADSVQCQCPNKFHMGVDWSGGSLLPINNFLPSNAPHPNVVVPSTAVTAKAAQHIFTWMFTTPGTINASTVFTLQIHEMLNRQSYGFDYCFDNIILARMNGAVAVTPMMSTICSGNSVQLNAASNCTNIANYTLVWQPSTGLSCNNCANPIASPAVTTVYTLVAVPPITTPPTPNAVVTVTVVVGNPNFSITTTTLTPCFPASYSLSINGAPTATWFPGGTVASGINVSPASPTTYTAVYTDTLTGCTSTATAFINPPSAVSLSIGGNSVYCTNVGPAIVTATAFPLGSSATFTWLPQPPILPNIASQTLTPNVPTVYTVNATVNGCPASGTFAVNVATMCCPPSTVGQLIPTVFNSASVTGPQMILNDITISSGLNLFQNGEFLMGPNTKIIVQPGAELHLRNAHIYACGINMWDGIIVQDGGHLVLTPGMPTMIEDAKTAIDLTNPTAARWMPYPVEAYGAIFNKNYIGINIDNANVNNLDILVEGCVFSSRQMTFNATQWPNTSTNWPDLRANATPTTDLQAPYPLQYFPIANLKNPYSYQPGHIGIRLRDIDNISGAGPFTGVDFGNQTSANLFNLFDVIGYGIDIENGSLTTRNNVFQNMSYYADGGGSMVGGVGIRQIITTDMNAGLFLSPPAANNVPDFGNRFWDCYEGVSTRDVLRASITQAIFRSTQQVNNFGYLPGYKGVFMATNRFLYTISNNQFNNINTCIEIPVNPGPYFIGTSQWGIHADNLEIRENFISPVQSTTLLASSEYVNKGVVVKLPNNQNLSWAGGGAYINSNHLNGVYNGIVVDGMDNFPTEINVNLISLYDDIMFGGPQRGIELLNTTDNVTINTNTVTGPNISNPNVSQIYCHNNIAVASMASPYIHCNDLSNGFTGFEFDGLNNNTIWKGNYMTAHRRGMALTNNGVIGQQGGPGQPSFNQWLGTWGPPNFCTWVEVPSDAAQSVLWVNAFVPWFPTVNGGSSPWPMTYANPANLPTAKGGYDCLPLADPYPPVFKTGMPVTEPATSVDLNDLATAESLNWKVDMRPNPTNGKLYLVASKLSEQLHVRVMDIGGKVIYDNNITTANKVGELYLNVENGIYLVEIVNSDNFKTVQKLVIEK